MPTCAATARAVSRPSPVTMITRTPSVRRLAISCAESARGGSLKASSPMNSSAPSGPAATAITRCPPAASRSVAARTSGMPATSAATASGAPFTTRRRASPSRTSASERLVEGSKGTKLIRSAASPSAPRARAAASTARSIGSCVASSLASAAKRSSSSSVRGVLAWSAVSARRFSVMVPVLSVASTSIAAASSIADRRVTSTPRCASSCAPKACASVKVAGRAAGTEATSSTSAKGSVSVSGSPVAIAYASSATTSATSSATR